MNESGKRGSDRRGLHEAGGTPARSGNERPEDGERAARTLPPPGIGRSLLVVAGLAAAMGARFVQPGAAPSLRRTVRGIAHFFGTGPWALLTGALAVPGIVAAGVALRSSTPEYGTVLSLRLRRPGWRVIPLLLVTLGLWAVLLRRARLGVSVLWDVGLFFGVLVLFGLLIHLLDAGRQTPATFRFTGADWLGAGAIGLASGMLASIGQTWWQFAWVGDEGVFYDLAKAIATGHAVNPFDLAVVYQGQPVLDSVYQGLVMRLTRVDVVGWRLSEVLVLAASAAVLYLLVRALAGRLPAVVAAAVAGSSHYLLAFAHIGYNNLHCVFWSELAVLMLVLAWRTGRAVFIYGTGCAVGLCLYTFQIALFIGPAIAVIQGISFLRAPRRSHLAAGVLMVAAFAMTVSPGLLRTPPSTLLENLRFYSQREAAARHPLTTHVLSTARSFAVLWHNSAWHHHYVASSLLDPISGLLLALGLVTVFVHVHKPAERMALVWFAVAWIGVGFSAYTPEPSLTRLLFIVPPSALLAGLAASGLVGTLGWGLGRPRWLAGVAVVAALTVIPTVNLHQLLVVTPGKIQHPREAEGLRVLQEHPRRVVVFVSKVRDEHLEHLLERYPWLDSRARFAEMRTLRWTLSMVPADEPPPLIVAYDPDLVPRLTEVLGKGYRVVTPGPDAPNALPVLEPVAGALPRGGPPGEEPLELVLRWQRRLGRHGSRCRPARCAVGPSGRVLVTCPDTGNIEVLGNDGTPAATWRLGSSGEGVVRDLSGVAAGPGGEVFALDAALQSVLPLDSGGRLAGTPITELGYAPRGLTVGGGGDLFVAVTGVGVILKIGPDGVRTAIGRPGSGPGQFHQPMAVVQGGDGRIVVLDSGNHRVQVLDGTGAWEASWSFPCDRPVEECGDIALDGRGHVLLSHPLNEREGEILVFDFEGHRLASIPLPFPGAPQGIGADGRGELCLTFPSLGLVQLYRLRYPHSS